VIHTHLSLLIYNINSLATSIDYIHLQPFNFTIQQPGEFVSTKHCITLPKNNSISLIKNLSHDQVSIRTSVTNFLFVTPWLIVKAPSSSQLFIPFPPDPLVPSTHPSPPLVWTPLVWTQAPVPSCNPSFLPSMYFTLKNNPINRAESH